MPRLIALLAALLIVAQPAPARAYTIGGGLTTSCHEILTIQSIGLLVPLIDPEDVNLPEDDTWLNIAEAFAASLTAEGTGVELPSGEPVELTKETLFLIFSAWVGVRAPDTEGHSVANLNTLRRVQADPNPAGQYIHALRTRNDDGVAGDISAIAGTKDVIRATFDDIADAVEARPEDRIIKAPVYLDYYGEIDVDVARVPYLFGRVAHTLQDSYSHMLRSEDGKIVLSVMNYEDALTGDIDERRDGLAHSVTMDDCTGPLEPLKERALVATLGGVTALLAYLEGDDTYLESGLSPCPEDDSEDVPICGWITYNPECEASVEADDPDLSGCCTEDNDYCGTPWLKLARESQTGPVLDVILCSHSSTPAGMGGATYTFALLGLLFLARRFRRHAAALTALLGLTLVCQEARATEAAPPPYDSATPAANDAQATPNQASAQALPPPHDSGIAAPTNRETTPENLHPIFVGVEVHGAALTDVAGSAVLDAAFGYGLRGGYRFAPSPGLGQWGLVGQVEIDHWIPTELDSGVDPGVLNVGVGGELVYIGGFVRSSLLVGTSTLIFDAALDDAGSTGLFVDLRPIGVRYRLSDSFAITFDPISFAFVAPVLGSGPNIRHHEYRIVLGVEMLAGSRNR